MTRSGYPSVVLERLLLQIMLYPKPAVQRPLPVARR